MIDELRAERDHIDEAIAVIQRLSLRQGKRRGRPPAWMAAVRGEDGVVKRRGRPPGSKNKPKVD